MGSDSASLSFEQPEDKELCNIMGFIAVYFYLRKGCTGAGADGWRQGQGRPLSQLECPGGAGTLPWDVVYKKIPRSEEQ